MSVSVLVPVWVGVPVCMSVHVCVLACRGAYKALFTKFISFLKPSSGNSAPLMQGVLHAFALQYTARDYRLVVSLGIYPALHALLSENPPAPAPAAAAFGGGAGSQPSPFGGAPGFGGSPFGGATSASPFGSAAAPAAHASPFGGASPFRAPPSRERVPRASIFSQPRAAAPSPFAPARAAARAAAPLSVGPSRPFPSSTPSAATARVFLGPRSTAAPAASRSTFGGGGNLFGGGRSSNISAPMVLDAAAAAASGTPQAANAPTPPSAAMHSAAVQTAAWALLDLLTSTWLKLTRSDPSGVAESRTPSLSRGSTSATASSAALTPLAPVFDVLFTRLDRLAHSLEAATRRAPEDPQARRPSPGAFPTAAPPPGAVPGFHHLQAPNQAAAPAARAFSATGGFGGHTGGFGGPTGGFGGPTGGFGGPTGGFGGPTGGFGGPTGGFANARAAPRGFSFGAARGPPRGFGFAAAPAASPFASGSGGQASRSSGLPVKVGGQTIFGITSGGGTTGGSGATGLHASDFDDALNIKVLNLALKLSHVPGSASKLGQRQPLTALLTIARRGRARAQVVAVRVLRMVLPRMSLSTCADVDAVVTELGSFVDRGVSMGGTGHATTMMWLAHVGVALTRPLLPALTTNKLLLATSREDIMAVFHSMLPGNQASPRTDCTFAALEVVRMLRALARPSSTDTWAAAVGSCVQECLMKLPRVARHLAAAVAELKRAPSARSDGGAAAGTPGSEELALANDAEVLQDVHTCLGALAVCGGMVDLLTLGSRVRHVNGDFTGVVVARVASASSVTIMRDGDDTETVVPVRKLEVIPAVPFSAAHLQAPDGSTFDATAAMRSLLEVLAVTRQLHGLEGAAPTVGGDGGGGDKPTTEFVAQRSTLPELLLATLSAAGMRSLCTMLHRPAGVAALCAGGSLPQPLLDVALSSSDGRLQGTGELEDTFFHHAAVLGGRFELPAKRRAKLTVTPFPSGVQFASLLMEQGFAPAEGSLPECLGTVPTTEMAAAASLSDGRSTTLSTPFSSASVPPRATDGLESKSSGEGSKAEESKAETAIPAVYLQLTELKYLTLEDTCSPTQCRGRIVMIDSIVRGSPRACIRVC